mmetsp:Transcript_2775/g.8156  ORF Transcript_2775/g.8156 Transcript_2775/m.8156 type:complete len:840 (+) Transcript_2775:131-2650(+)
MTNGGEGEVPSEYYLSDEDVSSASGDEGIENSSADSNSEDEDDDDNGSLSDDDDASSSSDDESMMMPYTVDDIQLPPHPKRIKWSDGASSSTVDGDDDEGGAPASPLPLVSTHFIPGGRLGRHFWTIDDVPEGSSFRFSNVSNEERRRMRKERKNNVAQERREEKKRKEKADSASEPAPALQGQAEELSPEMSPMLTKITPDDCISDHDNLDDIIGGTDDQEGCGDDDAESAASERSGWGASRRLSIGGDLEDGDDAEDEEQDDNEDDEDENDNDLAAGQRIEHSIQHMDTRQREKLVEAMMNDILKNMRAIEKRKREGGEQQKKKGEDGQTSIPIDSGPKNMSGDEDDAPMAGTTVEIDGKGNDDLPVPGGFSTWEAFNESCNKLQFDPNDGDGEADADNETKAGTDGAQRDDGSGDGDESDFFVNLLTNENVDDFVQAQAVEWMDDAQKDDDEDDDEEDEFDRFLDNYSSSRLSDDEEGSGTNATSSKLSSSSTKEELVLKHRFLEGGDDTTGDIAVDQDAALKRPAIERRRKGSVPTASAIATRSQRPTRPTLPPRQISSKRHLNDEKSKSTKKKKKKKSFAKRMFKISLQGEIDETKRKMEVRRHGSNTSSLSDHDSISADLNGSQSFRSRNSASGRDSTSRLGGSREDLMAQRPIPPGRHGQMQRSNNSGSASSASGRSRGADARRQQQRNTSGGRSVTRGQATRPNHVRASTGRGRGSAPRPPGNVAIAASTGRGKGGGGRGTMWAPGRGARGASQRTSVRAPSATSSSRQSKSGRLPEGRSRRTSSSSSSGTGRSKPPAASLGGGEHAASEEKKKKKRLFKLNLKSELVDQS